MKRAFDFLVAFIFIVLLSPIFIFFMIMIKLESPGKAIFIQQRVGLGGHVFNVFKFRSMVSNASELGSYYTTENDQRITRVGRFIRKTSIDELPQLFNVLKGDMSLVGPRPNVPAQRDLYTMQEWESRNSVRPGVTGLAQATLRSQASQDERTMLDLEYVNRANFIFDLYIIILTIKQVFLKGGN